MSIRIKPIIESLIQERDEQYAGYNAQIAEATPNVIRAIEELTSGADLTWLDISYDSDQTALTYMLKVTYDSSIDLTFLSRLDPSVTSELDTDHNERFIKLLFPLEVCDEPVDTLCEVMLGTASPQVAEETLVKAFDVDALTPDQITSLAISAFSKNTTKQ